MGGISKSSKGTVNQHFPIGAKGFVPIYASAFGAGEFYTVPSGKIAVVWAWVSEFAFYSKPTDGTEANIEVAALDDGGTYRIGIDRHILNPQNWPNESIHFQQNGPVFLQAGWSIEVNASTDTTESWDPQAMVTGYELDA